MMTILLILILGRLGQTAVRTAKPGQQFALVGAQVGGCHNKSDASKQQTFGAKATQVSTSGVLV